MSKLLNSYLWIPDIMLLSGFFNENTIKSHEKKTDDVENECKNKEECCKNSKIKFVIGRGRYVYWNFNPKMIIDLDWIELNSKHPINVILLEKRKNKSSKK
ncbi:MAG: hypothetical protein AYK22_04860 [Thermoplasmatales archaeon SG8-52-3]|nr:MAG: hypothetical protein AYK22_04860 [Thermoplasmatales archaeon SG8-52-3]